MLYKRRRRGQVTLFIIIGIFTLSLIALLFFFLPKNTEVGNEVNTEVIKKEYHEYVQGCFEDALKEGVFLLGIQGGAIYDYQTAGGTYYRGPGATGSFYYGEFILPYEYEDVIYNVSYGIVKSKKEGKAHPDVPEYPYGYNKLTKDPKIYGKIYSNPFGNFPGKSRLPPLCDYYGENSLNFEGNKYSCRTYDSKSTDDKTSIQEVLEFYIANKTTSCSKEIEDSPKFSNIEVYRNNAVAKVLFGADSISAKLDYEVNLKGNGTLEGMRIRVFDYSADLNVRLRKIHELASIMIENEVENIFYDIFRDSYLLVDCVSNKEGKEACVRDGMRIVRERDVCHGKNLCKEGEYDDIIKIIDDDYPIQAGKPYVFQFGIENRIPALDLIRQEKVLPEEYSEFDFVVGIGDSINITPYGYDPDEDSHTELGFMQGNYHYSLWKETEDQLFDYANCELDKAKCERDSQYFVKDIEGKPREWSTSIYYNKTKRNASYITDKFDYGEHNVKIEVCDNEGLCDFQVLKILVMNKTSDEIYNINENYNNDNSEDDGNGNNKEDDLDNTLEGEVCFTGDCCDEGKIAGKAKECYFKESYGCKDDAFLPQYSSSIKTVDDKGNSVSNNDVYVRKVTQYCSGNSNFCDGEIKEDLIHYQTCTEDKTCTFGSKDCSTDSSKIPECSDSSDCTDENQYIWSGNVCYHSCSNSCTFSYSGTTMCPAPESIDGEKMSGISKSANCMVGTTCYLGVACTNSGIIPGVEGETCLDLGETDGNTCYKEIYNPSNNCDSKGECLNKDEFIGNCDMGSFSEGRCALDSSCYYDISCESSGWDYKSTNYILNYLGENEFECDLDCSKKGYKMDNVNNMCYYNIRCDRDNGWISEKEYCHPNGIDGNTCWTSYGCNSNGCTSEERPLSMCT